MFEPFPRQEPRSVNLLRFDVITEADVRNAIRDARSAGNQARERYTKAVDGLVEDGCDPGIAKDYTGQETGEVRGRAHFLGVQTVLLSALHIESVVNAWGVYATGESFFKKHLDRDGTLSKIALLIALGGHGRIPEDHVAMDRIRILFKRRNELVHPKASVLTQEKLESLAERGPTDFAGYHRLNREDDELLAERALDAFKGLLIAVDSNVAEYCGHYKPDGAHGVR